MVLTDAYIPDSLSINLYLSAHICRGQWGKWFIQKAFELLVTPSAGNLWQPNTDKCLPWQEERAVKAETKAADAQLRAEQLAERLRELGVNPDNID